MNALMSPGRNSLIICHKQIYLKLSNAQGKYIYNVYYKPLQMFRQTVVIFRGFIANVYKNFASIYMLIP
jgi:hypothetical protein